MASAAIDEVNYRGALISRIWLNSKLKLFLRVFVKIIEESTFLLLKPLCPPLDGQRRTLCPLPHIWQDSPQSSLCFGCRHFSHSLIADACIALATGSAYLQHLPVWCWSLLSSNVQKAQLDLGVLLCNRVSRAESYCRIFCSILCTVSPVFSTMKMSCAIRSLSSLTVSAMGSM